LIVTPAVEIRHRLTAGGRGSDSFAVVAARARDLRADPAVEWLLGSDEPAVRYLTRRDVLGEPVEADAEEILAGPKVRALLAGQQPDGGFGAHPYTKWTGAHWRLVSLVELTVPAGEPRALAAAETVLAWLTSPGRARNLAVVDGLARRCASQEGNALAVCSRIGLAEDPRVERLARSLVEWQWPDGGWNCDRRATGRRSSFHESLAPAWGLHEYASATGSEWAEQAAQRAAELFLEHRVYRSLSTGEPIKKEWLVFHYPVVLALRRAAGARRPRATRPARRSARGGCDRGRAGAPAAGRSVGGGRILVASPWEQDARRGRGLGSPRPERDDHPERVARSPFGGRCLDMTARAIKRTTIPTAPTMFVTTAMKPATSLVSAQMRPTIIPTTSTATIAASQYRIRRLLMMLSLRSWGRFANRNAKRS
jgi:hypothetical protein